METRALAPSPIQEANDRPEGRRESFVGSDVCVCVGGLASSADLRVLTVPRNLGRHALCVWGPGPAEASGARWPPHLSKGVKGDPVPRRGASSCSQAGAGGSSTGPATIPGVPTHAWHRGTGHAGGVSAPQRPALALRLWGASGRPCAVRPGSAAVGWVCALHTCGHPAWWSVVTAAARTSAALRGVRGREGVWAASPRASGRGSRTGHKVSATVPGGRRVLPSSPPPVAAVPAGLLTVNAKCRGAVPCALAHLCGIPAA